MHGIPLVLGWEETLHAVHGRGTVLQVLTKKPAPAMADMVAMGQRLTGKAMSRHVTYEPSL